MGWRQKLWDISYGVARLQRIYGLSVTTKIHKSTSDEIDFIQIIEKMLERLGADQMQLVATTARLLWLRQNGVIYGGEFLDPPTMLRRAKEQVEACDEGTQRRNGREERPRHAVTVIWQIPRSGIIKLNWDASINLQQNRMGIGVIARNHEASPLAMLCARTEFVSDPTIAEAIAAWRAVELAMKLGFCFITLEGDALLIVQALSGDENCWSLRGQVANDAREMLRTFQEWGIQHVSRAANGAAHRLAKMTHAGGR